MLNHPQTAPRQAEAMKSLMKFLASNIHSFNHPSHNKPTSKMHFPSTSATVHFLHSRGTQNQQHNGSKIPDRHFIPQVDSSRNEINKRANGCTKCMNMSPSDFLFCQISSRYVWSLDSKLEVKIQPPNYCHNDFGSTCVLQPMGIVHALYHGCPAYSVFKKACNTSFDSFL